MTYKELYQMLIEAEARVTDVKWPDSVRNSSRETVSLIKQRMAMEGLTRSDLKRGYKNG